RRLYLSHCFRRHLYGSPAPAVPSRFLAPLGRDAGVERWDDAVGSRPDGASSGESFVAPVESRSQPLLLRRAREVILERATAPARPLSDQARFHAGDLVEHARFGRGTIHSSEMTGGGEEVVIDFQASGRRRFAVSDAVLRRVPG
ncbi:MAG: hypothetical protein ACRENV_07965, partial [Candidatus Dormibacteria bacterium]